MTKYTVDHFYTDMIRFYEAVQDKPFRPVTLPFELKGFGSLVENVFSERFITYKEVDSVKLKETNRVGVAFSGGKDSSGLAVFLRNKGYDVTLFHVKNMNRAYPDECSIANDFSREYGFEINMLLPPVKPRKGAYVENIAKNNLLIAHVLKSSQIFGITNVALGCAFGNDQMLSDYGFSDSNQNLSAFGEGVSSLFASKVLIEEMDSEGLSYKTLVDEGVDFGHIVSCMMPIRYRGKLAEKNINNGVLIRQNGCGQCYKCAMDYYYLENLGIMKYDRTSYKHYADVLIKQWDRVFVKKPKTIRDYFFHFLSDKYVNMENVFIKLKDSGVDLDKEI